MILITDGSADNTTRKGGWAAIVRTPNTLSELVGYAEDTTSNRMEMMAVIEGLRSIKEPSRVELVSDSAYVLNSIRFQWYLNWFEETGRSKPRPNIDLWHMIHGLTQYHDVVPIKVKGHSGDYWNHRADRLADQARREKLEYKELVPNFIDDRCSDKKKEVQCKLHEGHSGPHCWSNGNSNGVEPYASATTQSHSC